MLNYLRLCNRLVLLLAPVLLSLGLTAQNFVGIPQPVAVPENVKKVLTQWEVYRLNPDAIRSYINNAPESSAMTLQLGPRNWTLQLQPSRILGPNYFVQVSTEKGLETYTRKEPVAFKGYETTGGGHVRLTLEKDFINGFVEWNGERYYIEPLWHHQQDLPRDLFLVYPVSAVIKDHDHGTCTELSSEEDRAYLLELAKEKAEMPESAGCYEIEIAIAADKSMFDKYGSVGGVEAHNIAVINNVEGDYTGAFNHDLQFVIVTQFVVTGSDPWTNSNDAGTLLASFRAWGNAGNFGVPFDNGELWTNRNFDGSTIGIAYLNGMCNSNRYHCLQDFSNNSELLRCLTSHEIGHNMSANHDPTSGGSCPPNYIMCPFVSTSSNWSSNSITVISNYITNRINAGCFQVCGANQPLTADFDFSPNPACRQQQVQFTDQSIGNITVRSWQFPGGTPPASTQQNPIVTWNTAGTYNVVLTISGPGGTASIAKPIVINPTPTANFTFSYTDLTYTFTSTSQNASSYSWDFGDGLGYSNDQNPIYTYPEAGVYTVTLVVENDCGSSTKTALLNTVPTADFSASPTAGCAPMTVQFTNESSANASTFVWQFPGGSPVSSNLKNPIVVYQTSGTYTVTLTAFNGSGSNQITKSSYITVQIVPSSNFNFTVDTLTVQFTNNSIGATSFSWNFGDGNTSNQANPTHTYANSGTYTVTLTSTNACGSTTSTKQVTVIALPVAAFTANVTSGCAPLTVQFTNQALGNPTAWSWEFPGGTPSSSSQQNPVVTYNAPGNYDVTLIVTNAFGNDTLTQSGFISVTPPPAANFFSAANGLTVSFVNLSSDATTYHWDFGDGSESTEENPGHTYGADGTYTVTLTATGPCGVNTTTQTVTIITPPLAGFTASPTAGCGPLTVQFTNASSANAVTFLWDFPGGTPDNSTEENPTVIYTAPGTYTVTLTVSNAAGSNSTTQTSIVTVNPGPTAGFSSTTNGLNATFTNNSANADTYHWDFGDANESTEENPEHTYTEDGTYTVTLTSTGPCGTSTSTQTVTIVSVPVAGFTASPTAGCGPLTVQFANASSANAVTFLWDFPGGTPDNSTEENPTVTYDAPGTYTVTLTVTNAAGSHSTTQTEYVTVYENPSAEFVSDVNGATATFDNDSNNADSYHWDFGDGNESTEENPAHTYAEDGTYTVTLTATNPCGTSTFTQTVTIATPPVAGFTASPTADCGPLTVQFTSTSSNNSVEFLWDFPGGSPESSTEQNPVVTYTVAGTYAVTLTVSNAQGSNSATQMSFVTVFEDASADFNSTTNGATVEFENTSSNANAYHWDFGDDNESNAANPTHTYAEDGTYTVVLTAFNSCGSSTFTQTVTIVTPPTAGFTAGPISGCGPLTVQFASAASANATGFYWEFPGGTPDNSTEEKPTVTYDTPGTYSVTFTASNGAGSHSVTQTDYIVVFDLPTADFNGNVAGAAVNFSNNSDNATTYAWDFGDNNFSTEEHPSHTYTASGTYTVVLTATNDCGTSTAMQMVTVLLPPQAGFTASATQGCAPLEVTFTNASSADATDFDWTFEGGTPATSNEANPTVTFEQPGTYTVTLVASNAAGSNTSTLSVTVVGPPTAGFTVQNAGLGVVLTNTSQGATTYQWSFGDGNTSNVPNPAHTYAQPGAYTITLKASNDCGATEFSTEVEILGAAPIAAFKPSATEGCAPFTVTFADQSAGNPTAWNWAFLGGNPATSTAQNPTVTYNTPGVYSVQLEVTNPYGNDVITMTNVIEVLALPTAAFTYAANDLTVTFSNQSQNGDTYTWNFGDGTATSNEISPVHTYANPGQYTVSLTVLNNCGATTLQQMLLLTTRTREADWVSSFLLYPNPNTGAFTVDMRGQAAPELEFTLFDALGQLVNRQVAEFGTGVLNRNFDYGVLPAGHYTLHIRNGVSTMQVQVVVQR